MEKAFLIDVLSKTFIATGGNVTLLSDTFPTVARVISPDSSPFDPFHYELCTDMVDVVIEISCIYG